MPRMVHRGKEKSGARGVSAPAMLGALIVGHGTPTARPRSKEQSGAGRRYKTACYAQYTTFCCKMQI